MHIGSWANEEPTLKILHGFIKEQDLEIMGYHKEIYISDPRRAAEEKKKTILRYQVK
ncbi:MAG: hypothetical protein ACJA08_002312 [Cyclobacteriaceae bacterium]|jgi:hypothetical protein